MCKCSRYSNCKTIDGIVRKLIRSGEWVVKKGGRHFRLENVQSKHCLTIPKTPSDHRAAQNWTHHLRAAGVSV